MSNDIRILKIGGSLLTDKYSEEPVFATDIAGRLAREIALLPRLPVLVHGTGSYGKPPAKKYGYLSGRLSRDQAHVISKVSEILESLQHKVLDTLRSAGIPAVSLSAGALMSTRNGTVVDCHWQPVAAYVSRGIMPVIAGDFVIDHEHDFSVCSSDWIASHLAISANAKRLVFATDVAGVSMPGEIGRPQVRMISAEDYEHCRHALVDVDGDVSRGMDGKLAAGFLACGRGVETFIVDGTTAGAISEALCSDKPRATQLVSDKAAAAKAG